jgi:hypothetical protein
MYSVQVEGYLSSIRNTASAMQYNANANAISSKRKIPPPSQAARIFHPTTPRHANPRQIESYILKRNPKLLGTRRTRRPTEHARMLRRLFCLLFHNNTPFVLLLAIHDVYKPSLDQAGILTSMALRHWDTEILVSVIDDGDWADKVLLFVAWLVLVLIGLRSKTG